MAGRRIKKALAGKNVLLACVIVTLSLAGIGYAYWSSGMDIMTLVSTGNLDVQFDPQTSYETLNGSGNLTVTMVDPKTILVEGTVEEAVNMVTEETEEATIIRPEYSSYSGLLKFKIVNRGEVPAKLAQCKLENEKGGAAAGTGSAIYLLFPENDSRGNSSEQIIQIQAGANQESVDFNLEYLFNQPE